MTTPAPTGPVIEIEASGPGSALTSPIVRQYVCGLCKGVGCWNCSAGEITFTSPVPVWVSDTPAGVCECGGPLFDTMRDFECHDGISGGRLRYVECGECEWRQAK